MFGPRSHRGVAVWIAVLGLSLPLMRPAQADEAPAAVPPAPVAAAKPTPAPAERKALLWVVDSKPRIYLFGTIHIGGPRVLDHPVVVKRALEESGVLYTEVDMDQMDPVALLPKLVLPEGESLKQILPTATWKRLDKKMAELGMPLLAMDRMKPFVVWLQLQIAGASPEQSQGPALDQALFAGAKKDKKVVGGLETVDEQLAIFDRLTHAEQIKLIDATLDALEKADGEDAPSPLEGLVELYLAGDVEGLRKAILDSEDADDAFSQKLMRSILDDRNVIMAKRIIGKLAAHPDQTHFIAVGAAHYPGKQGILSLLRKAGYTVWRATEVKDLAGPPKPRPAAVAPSASRRAPGRVRRYRRVRIGPFCFRVPCRPRCAPRR